MTQDITPIIIVNDGCLRRLVRPASVQSWADPTSEIGLMAHKPYGWMNNMVAVWRQDELIIYNTDFTHEFGWMLAHRLEQTNHNYDPVLCWFNDCMISELIFREWN